jgi:N-acetylglucosamine-6-phosphate deacetylase
MERLLESAGGLTRLVTLAPEWDSGLEVTRELADRGIVVSAGHTNASRDELQAAIDEGLTMFTHLGNGCPATMPRHDNIIQRALSLSDQLWSCFIVDGAHIPFFTLKNYLDITGVDRAIIVTDAIVAADLGPGTYRFGRWVLEIGEDPVPRAPDHSHLVGSAITMPKSFQNLTRYLDISHADAEKLTGRNPRIALGQALR